LASSARQRSWRRPCTLPGSILWSRFAKISCKYLNDSLLTAVLVI
jgi:hypothetical protein